MIKEKNGFYSPLPEPVPITEQQWPDKLRPFVTIDCRTYMHENYISDAIEGFLMQNTSFKVEILIHDDASTDNTPNIIRKYEKLYPELFVVTYQVENQLRKNPKTPSYIKPPPKRGKYIAKCEGDDYWTDPMKLQKQVDLMEKHPEASLSVARCGRKDSRTNVYTPDKVVFQEKSLLLYFDDKKPYFHTSTFLIRKDIYYQTYEKYSHLFMGDTSARLLLNYEGPIAFINEEMSVYRITGEGVWTSLSKLEQDLWRYRIFSNFRKHHAKEKRKYYAKREIKYSQSVIAHSLKTFSFVSLTRQIITFIILIIKYDQLYLLKRLYRKFFLRRK